jgi:S1-C subfamily serine protease
MRDCDRLLAIACAVLAIALGVSALEGEGLLGTNPHSSHERLVKSRGDKLMADRIEPSMVPTADLPLVNVTTQKIPQGLTERGTSFYVGNDLWMSARHVLNNECDRIIMIVDGKNVDAQIKYLDDSADFAVVRAQVPKPVPALPIETQEMEADGAAYTFGFPQGILGGTAVTYLGRTKLKLGGFLSGSASVLAWTETSRYPSELDSIAGISGGPVINERGNVVGIIVAASVRRGRNYSVAPEILRDVAQKVGSSKDADPTSVRSLVSPPVTLSASADAMNKSARIVETYCIPPE